MHISLRSGEKIYVNGAVLRADRKVSIELLNDATFLLEAHVMKVEDASTPLRQLYFIIQIMLMNPNDSQAARAMFIRIVMDFFSFLPTPLARISAELDKTPLASNKMLQPRKRLRVRAGYRTFAFFVPELGACRFSSAHSAALPPPVSAILGQMRSS